MPRLQDTSIAVLVGAVAILSVACAPHATRWSAASSEAPARCNGVEVLDVQNNLGASILLFEVPGRPTQLPTQPTLLGPGSHTLEIGQAATHRYYARTVGQSPWTSFGIASYPSRSGDSQVRMAVRCQTTG
jgi:hypothetical protein